MNGRISNSAVIEKGAKIGQGTIIEDYVIVAKNVIIGKDCLIQAGTKIGVDPFVIPRVSRSKHKGVEIGDGVTIGANVTIQAGVKLRTRIGDGSSINHSCCLGHDIQIGKNVAIGLGSIISGFSIVHDAVYIGPGCIIKNKVELQEDCLIGVGSLVLSNVPKKAVFVGSPAEDLSVFKEKRAHLARGYESANLVFRARIKSTFYRVVSRNLPIFIKNYIKRLMK